MTTDRMNLELGVNVETNGTDKLTDLDKLLLKIKADQDKYNSIVGRATNGPAKAAKEALDIDRDRMRVLKMRLGYESKERDAIAREELRGIREADRARAQADRRAISAARELTRERQSAARQISGGMSRAGGAAKRLGTSTAVATAAGAVLAKRTVDTLTRSAVTIDDALVAAQIHVFGEQNTADSRKSALALRKRLMPVASKLGTKTADLMGAYVEAAQAGISDDLLDTAVEQGTKYAKMNRLAVPDVLEQSGYAIQGLKSFGKVTADTLKSYFDETSYIIATTSANRQELLAATKVGMAAGASVGMTRQETIAVLGSIVGVGGEGGQASRMLSTQGARVANWRNKGRDIAQKHHRTAEDRQFMDAVQMLGYGSSDDLANAFSKDFFGSLVDAQSKIKGISDPLKRKSITAQLFGKEFGALLDSVIMGGQLKEYRDKLNNASGFLNHNWDKFTGNLGFLLDKIGVVFSNVSETMGLALKPIWQEVSAWVDRFRGFDRAGEAVTNFTNGLLAGFGASSVTDLLTRVLGDPAKFSLDMRSVFLAGKGFAQGIAAVASGVKSLFSAFAGKDADAQAMGKLAGEVVALGAALTILAPALVTLASLTAIIRGLAGAAGGAAALVGGGTAAGTAAGAAGGVAGPAAAAGGGLVARILGMFGGAVGFNATAGLSKADQDRMTGRLGAWAAQREGKPLGATGPWQDVGPSKRLAEMRESLEKNTGELKRNTQAVQDETRKAAETKAKELAEAEKRRLDTVLTSIRNPAMTGTVGGGSSAADDLRARGFNVLSPNTRPNGANGNMPTADLGNGVSAPRDRGDVAQRARQAYDFFISRGYSPQAAAGIIASLKQESNFTAGSRGDGGAAHGIAQWHADRRANILRNTGINISTAGFGDQLKALDWEMRNGDAGAQRARRILMQPGISARQAGAAFVQHFERPARDERAHRGSVAEGYSRQFGAGSPPVDPAKVAQAQAQKTRDLGAGITKPSTAGKGLGDLDVSPKPVKDAWGNTLGQEAPTRSRGITDRVPDAALRSPRGGGAGAGGGAGNVHVQIGSVHGHNGEEVGRKVGDHVRDAMNRQMHDVDPGGYA